MIETGHLDAMPSPFAARWDPSPAKASTAPIDLGWIGEDADGIWLKRHPEAALLEHPEIWDVYHTARVQPEMAPGDADRLSAFEFDCKVAFISAYQRREAAGRKGGEA